jgi:hypothetical protein
MNAANLLDDRSASPRRMNARARADREVRREGVITDGVDDHAANQVSAPGTWDSTSTS